MCKYNISIDDAVMERVKPHFSGDDAMKTWLEEVLHQAMLEFANQIESRKASQAHSQELLQKLESLKDDPDGFFKMGGILGHVDQKTSWEQLREEALSEKFGI